MLFNRISRIIWGLLLLVSLVGVILTDKDTAFQYLFVIGAGFVFIMDFLMMRGYYGSQSRSAILKRRWHIYANIAQWMFWTSIIYVPFMTTGSLWYKIFIIVDMFIVATFTSYKYKQLN